MTSHRRNHLTAAKLEVPQAEYTASIPSAAEAPAARWQVRAADEGPSTSGRDADGCSRDIWLRDTAYRVEGTPLHLRIAFGSFWIELPLRRPQQQPSTPPPTPRTAAQLEDIPVTWEGTLLQQLLAESEIQAQLQTAAQTLDLDTVRRWARAKHGDAAEVERLLRAHIAWRADFVPGGSIPEAKVQRELEAGKAFLQGVDSLGRAVVVVLAANHNMRSRNFQETLQLIVYALDAAVLASDRTKNPDCQLLILFDLSGLQMANLDVKVLRAIFDLVQNHYPEHLAALWFLNAPFIFRTVWGGVQALLQPSTREKIRFLSGRSGNNELLQCVSLAVLPKRFGGDAELVPIHEACQMQRRQSSLAALEKKTRAVEHKRDLGSSRLAGAGRAVKRWSGASAAFLKRHNPMSAAAGLRMPKLSSNNRFGTPKWPQMQRRFSQMHRSLSMRLSIPHGQYGGSNSLPSFRASGKVLAAIPEMLSTLLKRLGVGAVQALSWLGRRFAWSHSQPPSQQKQPMPSQISIEVSDEGLSRRHGSSPSLTQLQDAAAQTDPEPKEPSRRRSESDCRRRKLPPLPMQPLPGMPES